MSARIIAERSGDAASWYRGTYLVVSGESKVGIVNDIELDDDEEVVFYLDVYNGEGITRERYHPSDLEVCYPEPYYDNSGEIQGSQTGRSYKRAPQSGEFRLPDMWARLFGEPPLDDNRIGFQYCIKRQRYPVTRVRRLECYVIEHINKGVVGFKRGEQLCIFDAVHYERLRELINSMGGNTDVLVSVNPG